MTAAVVAAIALVGGVLIAAVWLSRSQKVTCTVCGAVRVKRNRSRTYHYPTRDFLLCRAQQHEIGLIVHYEDDRGHGHQWKAGRRLRSGARPRGQ